MFTHYLLLGTARAPIDWRPANKLVPVDLRAYKLVIGPEHTVFARISLKGVPFWRWREFARLQCEALTPFSRPGAYARVEAGALNVWIWDQAYAEACVRAFGADVDVERAVPLAALCRAPSDGVWWVKPSDPARAASEMQLWQGGALVASLRADDAKSPQMWAELVQRQPELRRLGWPQQLPDATNRSLRHRGLPLFGSIWPYVRSEGAASLGERAVSACVALFLAGTLAWAGYWAGRAHTAHHQVAQMARPGSAEAERSAGEEAKRRTDFEQGHLRLLKLATTGSGIPVGAVLERLGSVTMRQGMLVREVEVGAEFVKATLAAGPGASPRLEGIVNALEQVDGFHDARLVEVGSQGGFQFEWRYAPARLKLQKAALQ
jgi:hypothetical protein